MTSVPKDDWLHDLAAGAHSQPVMSTTDRVAEVLRDYLIEGRIAPGTRMPEGTLVSALSVSRNTLREAFRRLSHERLVVHELNRGVFVQQLTVRDVRSIYQLRRTLELSALRENFNPSASALSRLRLAVTEGLAAAEIEDWRGLGTANMRYHQAIAGLAGNERVDEIMSQLLAELRLAFHVMTPLKDFHHPYLADNLQICELVERGQSVEAANRLDDYLRRAEHQIVEAFNRSAPLDRSDGDRTLNPLP